MSDDNQALTRTDQARTLASGVEARFAPMQKADAFEGLPAAQEVSPYFGAGAVAFTPEQSRVLGAPLTDYQIHIRPDDGNLYLPGVYYRRRLNEAFGMGAWAVVPVGEPRADNSGRNPTVYYTGRLYVLGRFAAQATGMGTFIANNPKSNYGTALESARTDCLTRICKDWIATELWDPDFSNPWRASHCQRIKNPDPARFGTAVYVWVKNDDQMFAATVPVQLPPNVPVPATNRTTGQPIMGNWPHPKPNPIADAERAMDDEFRRTLDAPARSDLEVQLQRSIDETTVEVQDKKTGEITKEPKATKPQIARIHILCREMNWPDDYYRNGLQTYYGVDSSALLTKAQAEDAILRMERIKATFPGVLRVVSEDEK